MTQHIAHIALLVREYDEAIEFYVRKLGFELVEDTKLTDAKRWVLVAPPGSNECKLLLARAVGNDQVKQIGNQSGGRVFLFLHTDNFDRDYQRLLSQSIKNCAPTFKKNPTARWQYLKICMETSGI